MASTGQGQYSTLSQSLHIGPLRPALVNTKERSNEFNSISHFSMLLANVNQFQFDFGVTFSPPKVWFPSFVYFVPIALIENKIESSLPFRYV